MIEHKTFIIADADKDRSCQQKRDEQIALIIAGVVLDD